MNTATLDRPQSTHNETHVAKHEAAHEMTHDSSAIPALQGPPRMQMYTAIHKALRRFMADTLVRVGAMDVDDADETRNALAQLGALLAMLRAHVWHENTFIHTAIEQRLPGAQQRLGQDHDAHLATIGALEAQAQALAASPDRDAAALDLYRQVASFVAENFEHMQVEETSNQTLLWTLFSDAELIALHERLLASIPMPEMADTLRWMSGALNFSELAVMLGGMQAGMPAEAFNAVLELMRPHLSTTRWSRLAIRLGVPQVPGIVAFAG